MEIRPPDITHADFSEPDLIPVGRAPSATPIAHPKPAAFSDADAPVTCGRSPGRRAIVALGILSGATIVRDCALSLPTLARIGQGRLPATAYTRIQIILLFATGP